MNEESEEEEEAVKQTKKGKKKNWFVYCQNIIIFTINYLTAMMSGYSR